MITREDLESHITRQQQPYGTSAQKALFEKTLSLYRVYQVLGCLGPADPGTVQAVDEDDQLGEWRIQIQKSLRGHNTKVTCNGRLIFGYDHAGKAFVR